MQQSEIFGYRNFITQIIVVLGLIYINAFASFIKKCAFILIAFMLSVHLEIKLMTLALQTPYSTFRSAGSNSCVTQ